MVTLNIMDDDEQAAYSFNLTVLNVDPWVIPLDGFNGEEDSPVTFTGSAGDTSSDRYGLTYMWDFGDGNTTEWDDNPTSVYTYQRAGVYDVTFFVRDDDLNVTAGLTTATIVNPPPGLLEVDDMEAEEDEVIQFTLTGSDTTSDRDNLLYRVDFGDGGVSDWSTLSGFAHVFYESGDHEATATVMDDDGDTASVAFTVTVENVEPEAEAEADALRVDEDGAVRFMAPDTYDTPSDLANLTYEWDFGDGDTAEGEEVRHVFRRSDRYTVELTVTDDDGEEDEDQVVIIVENVAPTAVISLDDGTEAEGDVELEPEETLVLYVGLCTDTPSDIANLTFTWDWDDGTEDEGVEAEHSYDEDGEYSVTLTVTDDDGRSGTDTLEVFVSSPGGGDGNLTTTGGDDSGEKEGGGDDALLWIAAILAVVIVVVILLAMILIMKKKPQVPIEESMQRPHPGLSATEGGPPKPPPEGAGTSTDLTMASLAPGPPEPETPSDPQTLAPVEGGPPALPPGPADGIPQGPEAMAAGETHQVAGEGTVAPIDHQPGSGETG
jgi:PKD repeat protein